ncbi:MAG: hypothetical protein J7L94_13310 [Caldisericaceae bacterium]|nr:hypothetical protein [Caldisericaceae bacterium]
MASGATYALIAASTAVSAYSSYATGQAQNNAAEANAKAAERKAEYDEQIHRERVKQLLSKQRAMIGKSGLEMSGSPLLLMEDTAKQGELDALAIRYGGKINASRYRAQAQAARTQQVLGVGSSLLTGATQATSFYNRPTKR